MTSLLFLFSIICFLSSCKRRHNGSTDFELKDFKISESLKGSLIPLQNLRMSSQVCVIPEKNLLILLEMEGAFWAKAYTLDSLKLLKTFVKAGSSNDEQLSARTLQFVSEDGLLYISDILKKQFFGYSVDSINSKSKNVLPVVRINFKADNVYFPVIVNSGKIVDFKSYDKDDTTEVLNFYDYKGELLHSSGSFPKASQKFHFTQIRTAFTGSMALSKVDSNIVVCYYYTDCLDLYSPDGKLLKRVYGPDGFDPEVSTRSVMEGRMNFLSKDGSYGFTGMPALGKSEIFVLYDGRRSVDRDGYEVDKLFCFDENLKPKTRYTLDMAIFNFAIDWNTKTLYGLTHEKDGVIVKYKL